MDQLDLRAVNFAEGDSRFTRLNLGLQCLVELLQSRLAQVDSLGKIQVIEFFEMMPQRRVDLGLARGWIQNVAVAHSLLFCQLHRQKKQRGMDSFLRRFLQVCPTQETEDQPELGKAVFRAIAARLADNLVQHPR